MQERIDRLERRCRLLGCAVLICVVPLLVAAGDDVVKLFEAETVSADAFFVSKIFLGDKGQGETKGKKKKAKSKEGSWIVDEDGLSLSMKNEHGLIRLATSDGTPSIELSDHEGNLMVALGMKDGAGYLILKDNAGNIKMITAEHDDIPPPEDE